MVPKIETDWTVKTSYGRERTPKKRYLRLFTPPDSPQRVENITGHHPKVANSDYHDNTALLEAIL